MSGQSIQTTTSPSEIYERFMAPAIFSHWSETLLELAAPQPGEGLLDLACGTGVVARMAASRVQPGGKVVGVDFNGAQIATARNTDPSIDWREGDASALSFPDHEFDLVVCQQGFQFFPDRLQAVREINRVLKPGGRIGIAVWSSMEKSPGYLALANALGRIVGPAATRPLDEIFAFPDPNQLRRPFADGGFPEATVVTLSREAIFASSEEFTRAIAVGSIMRRTDAQFSEETLDSLSAAVAVELAQYSGESGLRFPMEAQLLTASK